MWQRTKYLIFPGGWIFLNISLGIGMLVYSFSSYPDAASFRNKALSTTGIITETRSHAGGASGSMAGSLPPSYVSTVQFRTEQEKVAEFKASDICLVEPLNLCNGKKVQILYNPDNPKLAMVEGSSSPLDRVRNNFGLGLLFLLSGIFTFIIATPEYGGRFGLTQHR